MWKVSRTSAVFVTSTVALVATFVFLAGSVSAQTPANPGKTDKVVYFASDGMRPDLMERYARDGAMPTYRSLMNDGVTGQNGLQPAFPPNTGVGWYSLMTGTWPSEHGSTNNTYHRVGDVDFNNRTSFSAAGSMQADTLAAAAERAGKKVAQVDWVGGVQSGIVGPTVDFVNFFSTRGVLAAPLDEDEQAGAAAFGVSYQVAAFEPATGWTNVPAADPAAPPQQTVLTVATTFAAQNPTRTYDLYLYDSLVNGTAAYDRALLVPSAAGKNGTQAAVNLAVGDFKEIKLKGADGLIGTRAGQTAGFYVKLITLSPDLSTFKLYFTSVERVIATCATAACDALPAGQPGENKLEKYIADNLPTFISADFAPLEARIIDEATYVQQGRDLQKAFGDAVLNFILGTLQPDTDLAFVGYPVTDEFSHQFLALVTKTDIDGQPNPTYDDADYDGVPDGRVAIREGYIRSAYHEADATLALARHAHGRQADHLHVVRPRLRPAVVCDQRRQGAPGRRDQHGRELLELPGSCRHQGQGMLGRRRAPGLRQPGRSRSGWDRPCGRLRAVRNQVIAAFENLTDPANPGKKVILEIFKKEELRDVDGVDSLHPSRSGDVVVVSRPPYQFDAATPGERIALSQFFGQHGYLPDLVDLDHNINMHSVFVASGPGVRKDDDKVPNVRMIDVAPTIAFLMRIPGPQNARGSILTQIARDTNKLKEVDILDISDWHAQLTPLSEAADNVNAVPTSNPSFAIAGAAFLETWFDVYEGEANRVDAAGIIEVAGGDSFGGATPPISNFFGDKPTPPIMNMMGIDADALGNHSFDRGQAYLREELIPLAEFPMLSANIVRANGKTPQEWSPSTVFKLDDGIRLGVVGFTTESTPEVVFPGNLGPFQVRPIVPAVNAEARELRNKTDAIVALGHEGATGGTVTDPTGPLIDIADALKNVDVVIGDHNDLQVNARRPNGVLVVENRGKGLRFTRVRILIDQNGRVVYKTADYHKPWNIGVTPDPAIQAEIDRLTALLAPILGEQIGTSTKFIPRADQCGGGTGRTCESLVGNVVTDAMRTTYESIGVQFAITNSGGLRADLTCPNPDISGDFCPAYTPPPFPITRGQSLSVLPFGNVVVTLSVNGAELKTMLENGVSRMPAVDGRFPQVSGLCFTYDIALPAGSRVTSAFVADAAGNCTATAVDLTAASTYEIAENDFIASGGDGYPNFASRMTTQEIMEQVVATHITANSPLSPVVKAFPSGRINCADGNGATEPNCPVLVPSP